MKLRLLKKPFILTSLFIIVSVFTFNQSYAFFDTLFTSVSESVLVGSWDTPSAIVTPTSAASIISTINTNTDITLSNGTVITDIQPILNRIVYDQGTNNTALDEVFTNYTNAEIARTIDNYIDFASKFLVQDPTDPTKLTYPTTGNIPYYSIATTNTMLPGEHLAIESFVATANYEQSISNKNSKYGITISLSIYNPGVDISDYSLGILIDKNAFSTSNNQLFNYHYSYLNSNNTTFASGNIKNTVLNTVLATNNTVSTEVRKTSPTTTILYNHSFNAPQLTGNWGRVSNAPFVYLNYPSTLVSNATNVGLRLPGSGDGSKFTLNITFTAAQTIDGYLPLIPFYLVFTRGVGTYNPNPANVVPIIEYRVTGYSI